MGRRDDILSKIHPKYRGEIEAQLAAQRKPLSILAPAQVEAAPRERRVRQARHELNKLEEAYLDMLRVEFKGCEILAQSLRVRLANGDWYKPDFFIPSQLLAIEVKGAINWRGGLEFLKIAASQHRWIKFRLAWRKGHGWLFQNILP